MGIDLLEGLPANARITVDSAPIIYFLQDHPKLADRAGCGRATIDEQQIVVAPVGVKFSRENAALAFFCFVWDGSIDEARAMLKPYSASENRARLQGDGRRNAARSWSAEALCRFSLGGTGRD